MWAMQGMGNDIPVLRRMKSVKPMSFPGDLTFGIASPDYSIIIDTPHG
jgi:hypothetical protein